jgi:YgiT-type zinc finger domain-containing protein
MSCATADCTGEYESREITHTVIYRASRVVVEGLPAGVCPDCGHTRVAAETLARMDRLLRSRRPQAWPPRRPLRYPE